MLVRRIIIESAAEYKYWRCLKGSSWQASRSGFSHIDRLIANDKDFSLRSK